MPEDNEIFSLTHEEHHRIFETLKQQHFSGRRESKNPRAVIVCGQPGSGRSSQISTITQEFSDSGAVVIDESRTQGYTKNLLDDAIHGKLNVIIEDTLPNGEILKNLRENGYSTSVYVVSAHERESLLSLYEKYEGQMAERGSGDRPKIAEHDELYHKLPETLHRIEEEKLADEVAITDRRGEILYHNELKNNDWTKTPEAAKALEENRNRAWTSEEIAKYQEDWQNVIRSMYARGASQKEIDEAEQVRSRCLKSLRSVS